MPPTSLSRRRLLQGSAAGLLLGAVRQTPAASVVVADDVAAMRDVVDPDAPLLRVYSGGRWCEGPVWSTARRTLVFSDVRRNAIMALAAGGDAAVLRAPSGFANGNAIDAQGRLVSCEVSVAPRPH